MSVNIKGTMTYKGYVAEVAYSAADEAFVGQVVNTSDLISFHGDTTPDLEQAMKDVVDSFLAACKAKGITPEKPYSGTLNYRPGKARHGKIAKRAQQRKVSINDLVNAAVDSELKDTG